MTRHRFDDVKTKKTTVVQYLVQMLPRIKKKLGHESTERQAMIPTTTNNHQPTMIAWPPTPVPSRIVVLFIGIIFGCDAANDGHEYEQEIFEFAKLNVELNVENENVVNLVVVDGLQCAPPSPSSQIIFIFNDIGIAIPPSGADYDNSVTRTQTCEPTRNLTQPDIGVISTNAINKQISNSMGLSPAAMSNHNLIGTPALNASTITDFNEVEDDGNIIDAQTSIVTKHNTQLNATTSSFKGSGNFSSINTTPTNKNENKFQRNINSGGNINVNVSVNILFGKNSNSFNISINDGPMANFSNLDSNNNNNTSNNAFGMGVGSTTKTDTSIITSYPDASHSTSTPRSASPSGHRSASNASPGVNATKGQQFKMHQHHMTSQTSKEISAAWK